jgi:Zn-dependent peptidase ImmA (M78 family)
VSKVKPLLPGPIAAARRVLTECDVRHPRDIRVEAIAARYGAMVVYGPVETARGSIVRTEKRAVIWVDEAAKGQPRADFTGAHELGHHVMHTVVDHFAQCRGEEAAAPTGSREARQAAKQMRLVEREADHFAIELRMPERWAAPLCAMPHPELDDVYRLAQTFRASFHTSALRFVELTAAPCAFVHTARGRIKRSTETNAFPGAIVQRRAVHPESVAARLQDRRGGGASGDERPLEVPGAAWGDEAGRGFLEHAIALGPEIGVMSWIVPLE